MMKSRLMRWTVLGVLAIQAISTPFVQADGWGILCKQTTVQLLARQIDKLERHLDQYGTVVAKTPDVWGQARLTKYRREFEEILVKEKSSFKDTINASISRSDQAFLASALALQAAVSGNQATMTGPVTREVRNQTQTVATNNGTPIFDPSGRPVLLTSVSPTFTTQDESQPILVPTTASAANLIGNPMVMSSRNSLSVKDIQGFGLKDGVALEPTIHLNQLSRFVNHLHQLRRISDGDDKADAPGYALHLVRLPVSVLPGKKTREGYGAEVTFIAKPHLHERLLPTTFRGLVINDVMEHFAFPLATFIDRKDARTILQNAPLALRLRGKEARVKELTNDLQKLSELVCRINAGANTDDNWDKANALITNIQNLATELKLQEGSNDHGLIAAATTTIKSYSNYKSNKERPNSDAEEEAENLRMATVQFTNLSARMDREIKPILEQAASLSSALGDRLKQAQINIPSMAGARNRRALLPYPQTQSFEVMGIEPLIALAELALPLKETRFNDSSTLILDLETFLAEEINSAYEYLNHNEQLWQFCTSDLAKAIRARDVQSLSISRGEFIAQTQLSQDMSYISTLAWAIIVESALLNERLVEDMRELASSKNAVCLNTNWLPYYGPNPPAEAVQAFNDYVNCRWPIHVVAIDPVSDDQNVADRFSQRREMQLALSLAFASGRMGAQQFTRFNRQLELDMETIALHRTTVGFSHGDDTFGWRFMPRVQSPDTESPAKSVGRMLFTGGPTRNYLENESRLEPGIRECTAIVIMPSFVPYVIFDMRSNWFKLNNPARKELDLRDGVGLGADITSLRCLSQQCIEDQHLYRQDEVYRLNRAIDQLEKRLPLQTTYAQMPFENSLGGFEFFNSGVSDLAPQLKGYYGEPGVKIGPNEQTTLFLVGDHFSNHETKVIVGNTKIEDVNLVILSRQVLQITIPGNIHATDNIVDVHVATPYGVSNHVVIPVHGSAATAAADAVAAHVAMKHVDKFTWSAENVNVQLVVDCRRRLTSVCLQSDLSIESGPTSPFINDHKEAEFRGFMFEKLKGKDAGAKSFATSNMKLDFARGSASVRDKNKLEASIMDALKDYTVPTDIESFEIQGFLKFDKDFQTIIKLENRLKIKITIKTCDQLASTTEAGCANDVTSTFNSKTPLVNVAATPSISTRRPFSIPPMPQRDSRPLDSVR